MEHNCPYCGAPLPEDASFCPHCTQSIRNRQPVKVPSRLWRKGLKWVLALALILAVAGGLYARLGREAPSAGLPAGDTTAVILEEDENGMVKVSPDLLREYFPLLAGINFSTTSTTSDNIDDYLKENLQLANLVASRGAYGTDEESSMFSARSSGTRVCLLMFDRNTHLMGYFIGEPVQIEDGKWQIDVVSCDYDFTELYEEQLAAFEGNWEADFSTYIPPEQIEDSGAVWFLNGYNTGKGPVLREDDAQIYHLWALLHSPEPERQCREIERLEEFLPNEGRWRCYLLLDKDYNLLGYTMLDYQGNGG